MSHVEKKQRVEQPTTNKPSSGSCNTKEGNDAVFRLHLFVREWLPGEIYGMLLGKSLENDAPGRPSNTEELVEAVGDEGIRLYTELILDCLGVFHDRHLSKGLEDSVRNDWCPEPPTEQDMELVYNKQIKSLKLPGDIEDMYLDILMPAVKDTCDGVSLSRLITSARLIAKLPSLFSVKTTDG